MSTKMSSFDFPFVPFDKTDVDNDYYEELQREIAVVIAAHGKQICYNLKYRKSCPTCGFKTSNPYYVYHLQMELGALGEK